MSEAVTETVPVRRRLHDSDKQDKQVADLCYHWCPLGKHDWAHKLRGNVSRYGYPDRYREVCRPCREKAAKKTA